MSARVAVGLVGCGRVAERGYLPALERSASLVLVGVADPAADRRERIAPGAPGFDDVESLLRSVEPELVVVATPPHLHLPIAAAAAAAGVRSLVEKPPAPDVEDAVALGALVPPPWMGFNRRYDPAIDRLRELAVGAEAVEVLVSLTIEPDRWDAFAGSPEALLDLGPHAADLACWTTGRRPLRVRSGELEQRAASFQLELEGATAHVRVAHEGGWREEVSVEAGGTVERVLRGGLVDRARRALVRDAGPLVETLRGQLEAAGRAVRDAPEDSRLAGAADGVTVMAILDAVRRSAREPGTWVAVDV